MNIQASPHALAGVMQTIPRNDKNHIVSRIAPPWPHCSRHARGLRWRRRHVRGRKPADLGSTVELTPAYHRLADALNEPVSYVNTAGIQDPAGAGNTDPGSLPPTEISIANDVADISTARLTDEDVSIWRRNVVLTAATPTPKTAAFTRGTGKNKLTSRSSNAGTRLTFSPSFSRLRDCRRLRVGGCQS